MSLLPRWMWLVGQNGESSHTAQRATAHHSLPRLATVGHQPTERNGEPTTASSLNTARLSGPQAGTKGDAAGRGVSLKRVRGSRRKRPQ